MSRFHEPQHADFQRLNASIGFDKRLWPQDVAQSRAHARMLAERGIIAAEDRDALLAGTDWRVFPRGRRCLFRERCPANW